MARSLRFQRGVLATRLGRASRKSSTLFQRPNASAFNLRRMALSKRTGIVICRLDACDGHPSPLVDEALVGHSGRSPVVPLRNNLSAWSQIMSTQERVMG